MAALRQVPSDRLTREELTALRALFDEAWAGKGERFTAEDFEHALGGVHFLLEEDGVIVSHGSVVQRELHAGGLILDTGYVEAVATRPDRQRRGHATRNMRAVAELIDRRFVVGALEAGVSGFYERLGWVPWRGPTFVRTAGGLVRTAEEDGAVMILRTSRTPPLDLDAPLSCEWRSGDVW